MGHGMNIDYAGRLLRLAHFVEHDVAAERFHFGMWAGHIGVLQEGDNNTNWVLDDPKHPMCGTVACLLGWATQMQEFRDLGLYLQKTGGTGQVRIRQGEEKEGFSQDAAAILFGLNSHEFDALFCGDELLRDFIGVTEEDVEELEVDPYDSVLDPIGVDATAQEAAARLREYVSARWPDYKEARCK